MYTGPGSAPVDTTRTTLTSTTSVALSKLQMVQRAAAGPMAMASSVASLDSPAFRTFIERCVLVVTAAITLIAKESCEA